MSALKTLLADKIAAVTTAVGVGFVIVALLTRVNPAEGSVVRPEFLHTPLGRPIAVLLLVTSLPGWLGAMLCAPLGSAFQHSTAVWIELLLFQTATYWVLGKAFSIGWRKWRAGKKGSA